MKVHINFNGTKVVVPCGEGDLTVGELTQLATIRYKKAIARQGHDDYWVAVSSLKSREGGILDPDDLVGDVCDDREQLQVRDEKGESHFYSDEVMMA